MAVRGLVCTVRGIYGVIVAVAACGLARVRGFTYAVGFVVLASQIRADVFIVIVIVVFFKVA